EYVASASVLAAIGALEAQSLAPATPLYDPNTNFDRIRHGPGWVPWAPVLEALDRVGAPPVSRPPPPAPTGVVVKP
ncbi:MAG: hypothetical protein JO127_01560, partial [Caulobacteraceae bacterium]|nr:hypothetical protein [Caulobacteraceae bacterium]